MGKLCQAKHSACPPMGVYTWSLFWQVCTEDGGAQHIGVIHHSTVFALGALFYDWQTLTSPCGALSSFWCFYPFLNESCLCLPESIVSSSQRTLNTGTLYKAWYGTQIHSLCVCYSSIMCTVSAPNTELKRQYFCQLDSPVISIWCCIVVLCVTWLLAPCAASFTDTHIFNTPATNALSQIKAIFGKLTLLDISDIWKYMWNVSVQTMINTPYSRWIFVSCVLGLPVTYSYN